MKVFIFVNTEWGAEKDVFHKLQKIPEIKECFMLYGQFDIIITLEVQNRAEISKFRNEKIRTISGIHSTMTMETLGK